MPSIQWNRRWARDLTESARSGDDDFYGQRWGDPAMPRLRWWWEGLRGKRSGPGNLRAVARKFVRPHVRSEAVALEIGPGGGRWTSLLLPCREIILVDLNPEFFPYLRDRFPHAADRIRFYQTEGYELRGVAGGSVDFVFSFGTFVHIEAEGTAAYLAEIARVLTSRGFAVIQYSAKNKPRAREIDGFADMDAPRMETLSAASGLAIGRHDIQLLDHSNIIELQKPKTNVI